MAKASNLRAAPAAVTAVADAADVRNKTKPTIVAPKKKRAAAKKAAVKSKAAAAAKKAAASKSSPPKKAASKRNASPRSAQQAASKKISPPQKTAARKATPASKTAEKKSGAVKKAERRRAATRVAVPIPAARRGRPAALRKAAGTSPGKAPTAPSRVRPPQVFTVSHLSQDDFKTDGLRHYARYRDLGIAAATGGLCQAHVIRFTPPCTDEVRKRHVHAAELQLIYVLQGWMKNEFEGHGEQMMSAGSCWLQPSGVKHTVLDYSADCEVLEIIVPADFKTEELT